MVNIEHRISEEFLGGSAAVRSAPGGGLYRRLSDIAPRMILQVVDMVVGYMMMVCVCGIWTE
jgi:hypothetical protein